MGRISGVENPNTRTRTGHEKTKTRKFKPKSLEDLRRLAVESDSYWAFNRALDVLVYNVDSGVRCSTGFSIRPSN